MYAYWGIMAGFISAEKNLIGYLELFMTIFLTIMFINHLLLQIDHRGDKIIINIIRWSYKTEIFAFKSSFL